MAFMMVYRVNMSQFIISGINAGIKFEVNVIYSLMEIRFM